MQDPPSVQVASTADVDPSARIGPGSRVWHLAQVRENATLGSECVLGRAAYVGPGVRIGNRVKIQNHALVYEPAVLSDGVFIGPAVVLTNDTYPRSINADGRLKHAEDWTPLGVCIREGASVGARAVCVAPVTIGRWAMVAAGAVVTRDVSNFALVVGVPARQVGWVGRLGIALHPVADRPGRWSCPESRDEYIEQDGKLEEVR